MSTRCTNSSCVNGDCEGCKDGQQFCDDPRCYPNCPDCPVKNEKLATIDWILILIILAIAVLLAVLIGIFCWDYWEKSDKANKADTFMKSKPGLKKYTTYPRNNVVKQTTTTQPSRKVTTTITTTKTPKAKPLKSVRRTRTITKTPTSIPKAEFMANSFMEPSGIQLTDEATVSGLSESSEISDFLGSHGISDVSDSVISSTIPTVKSFQIEPPSTNYVSDTDSISPSLSDLTTVLTPPNMSSRLPRSSNQSFSTQSVSFSPSM